MANGDEQLHEAVDQLAKGTSGTRQFLWQLGYDFADALLPIPSQLESAINLKSPPRCVATACNGDFRVLCFQLHELGGEVEMHIGKYYAGIYPYALFLFHESAANTWKFLCYPDTLEEETEYGFTVELTSLTVSVLQRLAALRVEEDTAEDALALHEQIVDVCTTQRVRTRTQPQTTRRKQSWQEVTSWWLAQFSKYPILEAHEEARLMRLAMAGDIIARNLLVNSNLRLVFKIAKQYARPEMPLADLLQEGHLGLFRAVERFDITLGYRFSTYAMWWIRRAVSRAVAEQSRLIRLPVYVTEKLISLKQQMRSMEQRTGQVPDTETIATALSLSVKQIETLIPLQYPVFSLECLWSRTEIKAQPAYGEAPAEVEDLIMQNALREAIDKALNNLSPNHKDVLVLRFGLNGEDVHTLETIGELREKSRERVRQIEHSALIKLYWHSREGQWHGFIPEHLMPPPGESKPKSRQKAANLSSRAVVRVAWPTASPESWPAIDNKYSVDVDILDNEVAVLCEEDDDTVPTAAQIAALIDLEPELVLRHPSSTPRKARPHAGNAPQQPVFDFTD